MIIGALKEYLNTDLEQTAADYELAVKVIKTRPKRLIFPAGCQVYVMAALAGDVIPFQEIADSIRNQIKNLYRIPKMVISCTWFVCSSRGGIYLHEALAVKENCKYQNMRNRFMVFNTENGTVSLGPGHIQNKAISERMHFLLEQARYVPHEKLLKEVFTVFDVCLAVLK